jgi:hypothetical protein
VDAIHLPQDRIQYRGSNVHSNEPSGSIKILGISLLAEQLLASQERLYYMKSDDVHLF